MPEIPLIKLATVPFLNAKPLVYPLEKEMIEHPFSISYYNPALLSLRLFDNSVDIALIPVAELLQRMNYRVFPGISISSAGKVDSVALVLKKDIGSLRNVAVDSRSQSSTALLRVILELFHGISPRYYKRRYGRNFFEGMDAGMVIGDSGLRLFYSNTGEYEIADLGEIWTERTGLPFVYAVYAINNDRLTGKDLHSLGLSKDLGVGLIEKIAEAEYERVGISPGFCINYLKNRICYDLGEREVEGLIKYSEFLSELGYCSRISNIEFC